jgi:hypothetical protein
MKRIQKRKKVSEREKKKKILGSPRFSLFGWSRRIGV